MRRTLDPGPGRLIRIVIKAPIGPIEVKGQVYNGTMTPIGDSLPGDERQKAEGIAALVLEVGDVGAAAAALARLGPRRDRETVELDAFSCHGVSLTFQRAG